MAKKKIMMSLALSLFVLIGTVFAGTLITTTGDSSNCLKVNVYQIEGTTFDKEFPKISTVSNQQKQLTVKTIPRKSFQLHTNCYNNGCSLVCTKTILETPSPQVFYYNNGYSSGFRR